MDQEVEHLLASLGVEGLRDVLLKHEVTNLETLKALTKDDLHYLAPSGAMATTLYAALHPESTPCSTPPTTSAPPPPHDSARQALMQKYRELLKRKGELLAEQGTPESALAGIEGKLDAVREKLGFSDDPLKELQPGDRVRVCPKSVHLVNGYRKVLREHRGKLATVVEYHGGETVSVQLPNRSVVTIPVSCAEFAAEVLTRPRCPSGSAARHTKTFDGADPPPFVHQAWNQRTPPSCRSKPETIRRAIVRDRMRRHDPYTLHGFRADPQAFSGNASQQMKRGASSHKEVTTVELMVKHGVALSHVRGVLLSESWQRIVNKDSIQVREAPHALVFQTNRDVGTVSIDTFTPFQNLCASCTVVRTVVGANGSTTSVSTSSTFNNPPHPYDTNDDPASTTFTSTSSLPDPLPNHTPTPPHNDPLTSSRSTVNGHVNDSAAGPRSPVSSSHSVGREAQREAPPTRRSASATRTSEKAKRETRKHLPHADILQHEVEDLKRKLGTSQAKISSLQVELSSERTQHRVVQKKYEREKAAHGKTKEQLMVLKDHQAGVSAELGKITTALDAVMTTLSSCGKEWAEVIAQGSDSNSARMSRGVLTELLATNHEISEKLRQLNMLCKLTNHDATS